MTAQALKVHDASGPGSMLRGDGHACRRILMTVDCMGGVWRYAMQLASGLTRLGIETVFAGLGPRPSTEQEAEARETGELVWLDAPLEWMVSDPRELDVLPSILARAADEHDVDLLHLNAPSQACGLDTDMPVLVVSHSCVVTWWEVMRDTPLPEEWRWQYERNLAGFERADATVSPSGSHARLLERCYGAVAKPNVIYNAIDTADTSSPGGEGVFAAARWWDEAKNARVLGTAARDASWPVAMAGPTEGPEGQSVSIRHARALGTLGASAVRERMRAAGVVVSPSLYEPFGLVALEAARSGCALVLADIPTYRELWRDAAVFFDPADPAALADAINRLTADAATRRALAERARDRADMFTPLTQAGAMQALYEQLADAVAVKGAGS